jgi:hypothetical protein
MTTQINKDLHTILFRVLLKCVSSEFEGGLLLLSININIYLFKEQRYPLSFSILYDHRLGNGITEFNVSLSKIIEMSGQFQKALQSVCGVI